MSVLRRISRHTSLALAVIVTTLGVGPASASLVVSGGQTGDIPTPLLSGSNDLLSSTLFGNIGHVGGTYGATISQIGNAPLKYDFLGFEAGFANTFKVGANTIFNTETYSPDNNKHATSLNSPLASFITSGAGSLLFSFTVNSGAGSVANGTNPDGKLGIGLPNFFVSTWKNSLIVWLDDSGAGPDRDYDDFVVRISEVPLPPALLLFGSALVGMNWLRRRRQNLFG